MRREQRAADEVKTQRGSGGLAGAASYQHEVKMSETHAITNTAASESTPWWESLRPWSDSVSAGAQEWFSIADPHACDASWPASDQDVLLRRTKKVLHIHIGATRCDLKMAHDHKGAV